MGTWYVSHSTSMKNIMSKTLGNFYKRTSQTDLKKFWFVLVREYLLFTCLE